MSNQGEFIYSTHLWGSFLGTGLQKTTSNSSTTHVEAPKLSNRQSEKARKISEHEWDHEVPKFNVRKMSEDESINRFNPFESLI
jgi:hypothetical protein